MNAHAESAFGALDALPPILIALVLVLLASLLREPSRQRFMAIFVAGAGAAYLNGGLGGFELGFTAVATYVAYRGLESYRFIAIAWWMHTAWDVVHHIVGHPILAFEPLSSAGCAITDTLIAFWFWAGAPRAFDIFRSRVGPPAEDRLEVPRVSTKS